MFIVIAVEIFGEWVEVTGVADVRAMLEAATVVYEDRAKIYNKQTGEVRICRVGQIKGIRPTEEQSVSTPPPIQANASVFETARDLKIPSTAESKKELWFPPRVPEKIDRTWDYDFKQWWTPDSIKSIWRFGVGLAHVLVILIPLGFIGGIIQLLVQQKKEVQEILWMIPTAILAIPLMLVAVFLFLVSLRIACEYLLVLFRQAELQQKLLDHLESGE